MSANTASLLGTVASSIDADGNRSYSVQYSVETTSASDQGLTARGAPGIPLRGTPYLCGNDSDRAAFAKSYSEALKSIEDHSKFWIVTVNYSSQGSSGDKTPQETYDYPWQAPARVSGSGTQFEKLLKEHYANPAVAGKTAVKNSVGHYFDDEYVEESSFGITIEKDFQLRDWDINTVLSYVDCVNSTVFFGAPIDYYRMLPPPWSLMYTGEGLAYINCRFEFAGKYNGWNGQKRVDNGYVYRQAGKLYRFTDDQFRVTSGKGLLDGAGGRLADMAPPVFVTLNPFFRRDFANLQIPTEFSQI